MGTSEFTAGRNPAVDWHPIQRGVEILSVALLRKQRQAPALMGNWACIKTYLFTFTIQGELNVIEDDRGQLGHLQHYLSASN